MKHKKFNHKLLVRIALGICMLLMTTLIGVAQQSGAGKLLQFTGSNPTGSTVAIPNNSGLNITNAITLEAWVKRDNAVTGPNRIFTRVGETYTLRIGACCDQRIQFLLRNSGGVVSTFGEDVSSFAGQWIHLAAVWDGNGDQLMKIYINGRESAYPFGQGSIAAPLVYPFSNELYIGLWSEPFVGQIDQPRIWNVARTQTQIQQFMHKTEGLTSEAGLVSVWNFNEGTGTTTTDPISSNNGTLVSCDRFGSPGCTGGPTPPAWANSTAPFGDKGAFVESTLPTGVGPAGGTLTVTISSVPDLSNNLGIYQFGTLSGLAVTTGETFPVGFTARSNIVWGVNERGAVTANMVFDYSGHLAISNPSQVEILKRTDSSDTSWELVTETSRDDTARTITINGVSDFSEFALGFPAIPTAATVQVGGRVYLSKGKNVKTALVRLTDSRGEQRTISTDFLGNYQFEEVVAGETYVLEVFAKRHRFAPRLITVTADINELNFIPEP